MQITGASHDIALLLDFGCTEVVAFTDEAVAVGFVSAINLDF